MTIKMIAAAALFTGATAIFCINSSVAQTTEAISPLPGTRLAGQGLLRFWGMEIYRARLWLHPEFQPTQYAAHPLALELTYLRNFSAQDIAQRSIQEMRRVGPFTPTQAEQWQQALQAALPDVQPGDRLTGLYQPDQGVVFQKNGQTVGSVPDAAFARLFFGIWLSPQTSEPALRQALLALPATAP